MRLSVVILLISAFFLSGCGEQRARVERLTEERIYADMQESMEALRAKDLRRVLRDVAPDWQMTLTVDFEGNRETRILSKRDYRDHLKTCLRNGDYISLSLTNVTIRVSEDGEQATVSAEVHQEFAYRGQTFVSHGTQTNTVRLIDGFPTEVKAEGFTRQEVRDGHPK